MSTQQFQNKGILRWQDYADSVIQGQISVKLQKSGQDIISRTEFVEIIRKEHPLIMKMLKKVTLHNHLTFPQ